VLGGAVLHGCKDVGDGCLWGKRNIVLSKCGESGLGECEIFFWFGTWGDC
jgi:hypothetical protein